ncbi:MAG: FAD-dependent monooxygenase, partial [Xanthobacteraceae bacterium]
MVWTVPGGLIEGAMDSEVLIVGAGPTGLTLAIDLGRRGIKCTVVEQKERPAFLPKMERVNARTMEIYRRMGLSQQVRAAGLRSDWPMDVYIVLALNKAPLLHLPYPSVTEAQARTRATNNGSLPLEPYQLISQYTLEPLLKSVAETFPSVTVRFGCEFVSLEQDGTGITAQVRNSDGSAQSIRAAYLVGCDGGSSPVRRELAIELAGEGNLLELRQALYRCVELVDQLPIGNGPGRGRHYHVADDRATFLIMQDSTRHWTLHSVVDTDDEMDVAFERTVGVPVKYERLSCAPWRQNLLLAERYGKDRVFLAGDSVHLVIP